ncbi:hypothetical protein GCM10009844_08410 [Nocardioides koreensis]|uniref:WD40 repeat domain-containing protein n=1 Tax=Nocardioides koreensis TaxID=433651 RepID=A0ABP5L3K3_9ACTN
MRTESLREELHRIGESAPVADVPDDTWARARRARRRGRVLAGAAVAVLLLALGGVTGVLPRPGSTPVAGSSAPGLPDHLYAVPDSARPADDLAAGRTVAAWIDPLHRRAVLVGAVDGAYHVVDLPGMNEVPILDEPALALSPDGYHLAWAFGDESARQTGIRVLDLRTGRLTTAALDEGEGVSVLQLAFAPGGRWLGWSGAVLTYWDEHGSRADRIAVGRLDIGTDVPEVLRAGGRWPDPTVIGADDRGRVQVLDQGHLTTLGGRHVSRTPVAAGRVAGPVVLDPASGLLATGVGGNGPVAQPGPGTAAVEVDPVAGGARAYPSTAAEAFTTALAWVGPDVLVAVAPLEGSSVGPEDGTLELVGPGHAPRVVGHLDASVPWTLAVASDLVTAQHPTVSRPEPDWPWSDERLALTIGLGVAGALALLVAARLLLRRRLMPR